MKKYLLFVIGILSLTLTNSELDAQTLVTLGTGTSTSTTYQTTPANNYYKSQHMQLLYTAAEFQAQGLLPISHWINSIAFDVVGLPSNSMPDYSIKIGTLPATDYLEGAGPNLLPATNFTTVYTSTGNQTFTTGWNTFTFNTPFLWNGTDNIVIDVCWGISSAWTSTGTVKYTQFPANSQPSGAAGGAYNAYYRTDFSNTCPISTSISSKYTQDTLRRANAQFSVDLYSVPCYGQPDAGTLVASPNPGCIGQPFLLELTNNTFSTNLIYDWQQASPTAPNTFSTIPGASNSKDSYSSTFAGPMYYRCIVYCDSSGLADTSNVVFLAQGSFFDCYCNPSFSGSNTTNFYIDSVGIEGTNLANGSTGQGAGGIQVFPPTGNTTALLSQDTVYNFTMKRGTSTTFGNQGAVWIDFNQDGIYNATDEYFFIAKPFLAPAYTGQITIPNNIPSGPTGMRVLFTNTNHQGDPCLLNFDKGEVEDYVVEIDFPDCTNPLDAGTAFTADTAVCSGFDFTLIDTGHSTKLLGLSYQWESSTDGVNFSAVPGATSDTATVQINTPTYFRFNIMCNGVPNYSNIFFVSLLPDYACYCPSQATVVNEMSDIGAVKFGNFLLYAPGGSHLINPDATRRYTSHLTKGPIEATINEDYEYAVYHVSYDSVHTDAKVTVFIDFDRDGVYESATERIYSGISTSQNYYLNDEVTIPADAVPGLTGMRVILNEDIGPNVPSDEGCGLYDRGETEDYLIKIEEDVTSTEDLITGLQGFSVYPNPNQGKELFYLINTDTKNDFVLKIQNIQGQIIHSENIQAQNQKLGSIDVSGLSDGIYLIMISNADGQTHSQKFTVMH